MFGFEFWDETPELLSITCNCKFTMFPLVQNTAPSLKIHKLIWNRVNEIQCENVPKNKVSFQRPNNCAFVITVANL